MKSWIIKEIQPLKKKKLIMDHKVKLKAETAIQVIQSENKCWKEVQVRLP